ncbi:cupin-like domain-containing protein [Brevundimonas sp. NPDC092305]|uniref:cupin-like domain-containing protein n=1 Tax=Brevundimonas sp. NPDC092305 TaxID=3363957 RepID=UPI00381AE36F
MQPTHEWRDVAPAGFQDIRKAGEPAVMRGLTADWPMVRAARAGQGAKYLKDLAGEGPVPFMRAPAQVEGRLHYAEGAAGRNFRQQTGTLAEFLDQLETEAGKSRPDALALQGLPAPERLAAFAEQNPMPVLPPAIIPRLWIGNAAKVAIHHDPSENIACVAAGRRRFTLFPPEAVGDLYMGPFHETPAGVQVSMVHLTDPDLDRFPRFARAMEVAQTAELEPGDAIYIPYQWYHHVESLEPFNVLVNYWWDAASAGAGSPWDAMMHGMMSLRTLPPDQRRAWKAMFDHYVFQTNGDPGAHLPEQSRGVLSPPTAQSIAQMRRMLLDRLGRG